MIAFVVELEHVDAYLVLLFMMTRQSSTQLLSNDLNVLAFSLTNVYRREIMSNDAVRAV